METGGPDPGPAGRTGHRARGRARRNSLETALKGRANEPDPARRVARVLAHYDIGALRSASRIERGFVNENWAVETEHGHFFLKVRHPGLCRPGRIRAQHRLMHWLRECAFPAPAVVPTAGGETVVEFDGRFCELHSFIEGEPCDPQCRKHVAAAGATLAAYHTAVGGFTAEALFRHETLYSPEFLRQRIAALAEAWQLDQDPELASLAEQLRAAAIDLEQRFLAHPSLPWLVIHGDYYAGNLLLQDDRVVAVVDYDKACWQPRVVELAEALIYFASSRPGHLRHLVYPGFLDWQPWACFLESYADIAVPDNGEIAALPDYVRAIWLSMSLERLAQERPRPSGAAAALQEVLSLGRWAEANTARMVEVSHSAVGACHHPDR